MPSLGFDCMGQIIHNKQNMSHQTAPEYDRIPQQVDPVVVPREYLPLKRFYQILISFAEFKIPACTIYAFNSCASVHVSL